LIFPLFIPYYSKNYLHSVFSYPTIFHCSVISLFFPFSCLLHSSFLLIFLLFLVFLFILSPLLFYSSVFLYTPLHYTSSNNFSKRKVQIHCAADLCLTIPHTVHNGLSRDLPVMACHVTFP
jgi:hypothetical protein